MTKFHCSVSNLSWDSQDQALRISSHSFCFSHTTSFSAEMCFHLLTSMSSRDRMSSLHFSFMAKPSVQLNFQREAEMESFIMQPLSLTLCCSLWLCETVSRINLFQLATCQISEAYLKQINSRHALDNLKPRINPHHKTGIENNF